MQYSHLPSWLSFLVDQDGGARRRSRPVRRGLREVVAAAGRSDRPELYVFGESLGSFGGENAFSGEADLAVRTTERSSSALPTSTRCTASFVDGRDAGSPEIEPVFRDGRVIRFANRARESIPPDDQPWTGTRVVYLQHASDPVTWWSPDLILAPPRLAGGAARPDVSDSARWFPLITFWQLTADLALGFSTHPGYGHNYSGEHVDAWNAILQPEGWTPGMLDELRAKLRRY